VPRLVEPSSGAVGVWIHRQQLLGALDRESDLRSDVLGPVLDGLRWAYPYRLASQKRPGGDTVTIDISGPVAATWHVVASEQVGTLPRPRATRWRPLP
jgi:hypothetical protein